MILVIILGKINMAPLLLVLNSTALIVDSASDGNVSTRSEVNSGNLIKAVFCIISISSIIPNVLFLSAMLFNDSKLRGGYPNILLYSMMISDALAGNDQALILLL